MQAAWTTGQTRLTNVHAHHDAVVSEQLNYQLDVFRSIQKAVLLVCAGLGCAYLIPFIQQGSWPSFIISLILWIMSGTCGVALFRVNSYNFTLIARIWLTTATCTVTVFAFFQSSEFMNIAALGATVVIVLAIFLEPTRISYRWAWGNIAGYILVTLGRSVIHIPSFDVGSLYPFIMHGTPIVILFIMTEMGRVTTQHFKSSLVHSEAQRRQLETQGQQLVNYAVTADNAREKAERADQVKSAFLASMSHELRTPLNAVINFTQFVIDGDTGPVNQTQKDLLTDVVRSGKHLLNLINDVLDISKIEAGSLNLFVEDDVNLNTILNHVVSTGQSLLKDKSVHLHLEAANNLPLICGDRQRIFQILLNIMSNACKFTETGEIAIYARRVDDSVMVSISDTGPGIAPEDQGTVFEAFKQTQTGLRRGGGTGLGMAISKNLVEAHGGRLWFESEPDHGTTFFVLLPIKSEALMLELP